MSGRPKLPRSLAVLIVAVCAVVAVVLHESDFHRRSSACFHDLLHVPGFALILVLLWLGFPEPEGAPPPRRARRLFVLFLITVGIGIAVELAQAKLGGDADVWDVARDIVGAGGAALIVGSMLPPVARASRFWLRSIALAGLLVTLIPAARAIADEARADRQFPVLADFCSSSDLGRFNWSAQLKGTIKPASDPGACGELRVELLHKYSGLYLEYFPRDWRGWREFSFTCVNPSATPLQVTVRIDDLRHNEEYQDRFNRSVLLAPGRNDVGIPLADVESAPVGRKLDLAHVRSVIVFAGDLQEPRSLDFGEFRLMR